MIQTHEILTWYKEFFSKESSSARRGKRKRGIGIKGWISTHPEYKVLIPLSIIFFSWVFFYLSLHQHQDFKDHKGEFIHLNAQQILTITNIQEKHEKDTLRSAEIEDIKAYLGDFDITIELNEDNLRLFYLSLDSKPIKKKSYFFLCSNYALIEVLLWALMGVVCNSIYRLSEYIRRGQFDTKEGVVYFVKLLYAPVITLIIYLGSNFLNADLGTQASIGNTVVLSFVLGFFSGRSIELLHKIKDILFPNTQDSNPTVSISSEFNEFSKLDSETQKTVIRRFNKENGEDLIKRFPEIQTISAKLKRSANQNINMYAISFLLTKKEQSINANIAIPRSFQYTYAGRTYTIPTDIVEGGKTEFSLFIGEGEAPKKLGLSCSRKGEQETGSIGLKVEKKDGEDKNKYLLSCYHVLCATELRNGKKSFTNTGQNVEIISPSEQDRTQPENIVAEITEGKLDNYTDSALAVLSDGSSVDNELYDNNGIINDIREVYPKDVNKLSVKLSGRTSGRNIGVITDDFVDLANIDGNVFYELIETDRMSFKGDSGAPVIDFNNNIIGILVADNSQHSYVIPINTILARHQIKIPK